MPPKHALITGGSRGIGLAIAQHLARKNYACTLIARSKESLEAAISTLPPTIPTSPSIAQQQQQQQQQQQHHHHSYIAGDISNPSFWQPSTLLSTLPRHLDLLVNSAGVTQTSLLARTSDEEVRGIVDTNLTGLMLGTRFLVRRGYLKARRGAEEKYVDRRLSLGFPFLRFGLLRPRSE